MPQFLKTVVKNTIGSKSIKNTLIRMTEINLLGVSGVIVKQVACLIHHTDSSRAAEEEYVDLSSFSLYVSLTCSSCEGSYKRHCWVEVVASH